MNPRPPPCEGDALPAELLPHVGSIGAAVRVGYLRKKSPPVKQASMWGGGKNGAGCFSFPPPEAGGHVAQSLVARMEALPCRAAVAPQVEGGQMGPDRGGGRRAAWVFRLALVLAPGLERGASPTRPPVANRGVFF